MRQRSEGQGFTTYIYKYLQLDNVFVSVIPAPKVQMYLFDLYILKRYKVQCDMYRRHRTDFEWGGGLQNVTS